MNSKSLNNAFKVSVGSDLVMVVGTESLNARVQSEIYFNKNRDLQTQGQIDL